MSSTLYDKAHRLLQPGQQTAPILITEEHLRGLPEMVQRYLRYTDIVGKENIQAVYVKQKGSFRMRPDQKWLPMIAEQYYTTNPPTFHWKGKVRLFPLIWITAQDQFDDGHGRMVVKLFPMIKLIDGHGPEMDQGTLGRYLSEIAWYPTAWLSSDIQWQAIDDQSIRATIAYKGVCASAVLCINQEGQLLRIEEERSMSGPQGTYSQQKWFAEVLEYQDLHGLRLPLQVEASWGLAEGDFSYFRCTLTEILYQQ
jgi:hypothetical protein